MIDEALRTEQITVALARADRGEPLSLVDLASIWRVSVSRAHQLEKAGQFDQFKLRPPIGPRRFSGVLVHRYLTGQPVYEPVFGAKRHRA